MAKGQLLCIERQASMQLPQGPGISTQQLQPLTSIVQELLSKLLLVSAQLLLSHGILPNGFDIGLILLVHLYL